MPRSRLPPLDFRLPPVPFHKHPSAAAANVAVRHPVRTRMRRPLIVARHPDVLPAIPAVIAANPDESSARSRTRMLHNQITGGGPTRITTCAYDAAGKSVRASNAARMVFFTMFLSSINRGTGFDAAFRCVDDFNAAQWKKLRSPLRDRRHFRALNGMREPPAEWPVRFPQLLRGSPLRRGCSRGIG